MNNKTNTFITVNPLHQGKSESNFWRELAYYSSLFNWNMIQLAMRPIPEVKDAHTIQMPSQLNSLTYLRNRFSDPQLSDPVEWLETNWLNSMVEWEHLRLGIVKTNPAIRQNLIALAHWVDLVIKEVRPSVIMTWNKLDHLTGLFWNAAYFYEIERFFIERSPCDDMWIESTGQFGESEIFESFPKVYNSLDSSYTERGLEVINSLKKNPYGQRAGEGEHTPYSQTSKKPVFLLLMDNIFWCGWEQESQRQSDIDFPLFKTPDEALNSLHQIISDLSGQMIVKKHPVCKSITPDRIPQGSIYHDGDLSEMMDLADVIVVFNSKTAYAALAINKPVVTLACNPISVSGATYHTLNKNEVKNVLTDALHKKDLDIKLSKLPKFLGWLSKDFFYSTHSTPPLFKEFFKDALPSLSSNGPSELFQRFCQTSNSTQKLDIKNLNQKIWNLSYYTKIEKKDLVPLYKTAYLKAKWKYLLSRYDKIAFYGAGKFLKNFFTTVSPIDTGKANIQIFDDNPEKAKTKLYPVLSTDELVNFVDTDYTCIIMATDTWQKQMKNKLKTFNLSSEIIDLFDLLPT